MKQLFFLFLLQFFTLHILGQSAYTKTDLNLRSYRSTHSSIIGVIPSGEKVTVQYCDSYWCKVQYQNAYNGFVSKRYLKKQITTTKNYIAKTPTDRQIIIPKPKVDYYENSFGEMVQRPTYYTSPPSGASAVCRDGSYSFSRNRRGTCSHHGGVSEWLKSISSNYSKIKYSAVNHGTISNYNSIRCNGITQKGYRCKRKTKSSGGYCWQH